EPAEQLLPAMLEKEESRDDAKHTERLFPPAAEFVHLASSSDCETGPASPGAAGLCCERRYAPMLEAVPSCVVNRSNQRMNSSAAASEYTMGMPPAARTQS